MIDGGPSASELLRAVRRFLGRDVVEALADPAVRFRVLIAANVLGLVERYLERPDDHDEQLAASLMEAIGADPEAGDLRAAADALDEAIRAADDVSSDAEMRDLLRELLRSELALVNPRFDLAESVEGAVDAEASTQDDAAQSGGSA